MSSDMTSDIVAGLLGVVLLVAVIGGLVTGINSCIYHAGHDEPRIGEVLAVRELPDSNLFKVSILYNEEIVYLEVEADMADGLEKGTEIQFSMRVSDLGSELKVLELIP